MYIYERKLNKTRVSVVISFIILSVCVGAFFLLKQNNAEPVGFTEKDIQRLQLPSVEYQERFVLPYTINAKVLTHFYDPLKSDEVLEQAIVEFEGVYRPSQGVDFGFNDKVFEVVSMLSGEVIEVKDDPLMGKSVAVQSNDITVTYQSLSQINVKQGDKINQNTVLGLSGENLYNQDLGIHLHIVAEKNGKLIDPIDLVGLKVDELD